MAFSLPGGSIGGLAYAPFTGGEDTLATFGDLARPNYSSPTPSYGPLSLATSAATKFAADKIGGMFTSPNAVAGMADQFGISPGQAATLRNASGATSTPPANTSTFNGSFNPSEWNWGNIGTGAATAGFGIAGGLWNQGAGNTNAGAQIGSGIGGAAGSFLGPPGAMFGSMIGGTIGEQFGPPKTVGPNANVNFGVGPDGRLLVGSAGGDNGFNITGFKGGAQNAADNINLMLALYGGQVRPVDATTEPFGIGGGTDQSDMTIRLGDWMGPALNENSFAKALIQQGYIQGLDPQTLAAMLQQFGGADPQMVMGFGQWGSPESLSPDVPIWRHPTNGMMGFAGGINPTQFLALQRGIDPYQGGDSTAMQFMYGAPGGSEGDTPGQQESAATATADAQAAANQDAATASGNVW